MESLNWKKKQKNFNPIFVFNILTYKTMNSKITKIDFVI